MNTMRVFLHDLLWKQDPEGFKKRIDTFLSIAAKHKIRPMFVLFDSCWDPNPEARQAARPQARRSQLGLDAEPGIGRVEGPGAVSTARSLRERSGRRLRQ